MLKISVVIPTYKPKDYLWECLDSLYMQTLDKSLFEVIMILNGCNQPWKDSIEGWILKHPNLNIIFIQTEISGVSNARNIGIETAKGEYITFIDDDDYISSEYLECMLAEAAPDAVVIADSRAFEDGSRIWLKNYTCHNTYLKCADKNHQSLIHARAIFNGPCMKLLPSSFIHGFHFDKTLSNGEDSLFMFQISKSIKRLTYADEKAIYYRRFRDSSLFKQSKPKKYWLKNAALINGKYIRSWWESPFSYNFPFFINRIMANIKGLILHLHRNN